MAPVNAVPVMVTAAPTCPDGGLNPVMVGTTLKMDAEVAVPAGVVTVMGPVVAPVGTLVVIFVSEFTVNVALVPLNAVSVAPVNPEPVTTTEVPTCPVFGVNEEMARVVASEGAAWRTTIINAVRSAPPTDRACFMTFLLSLQAPAPSAVDRRSMN